MKNLWIKEKRFTKGELYEELIERFNDYLCYHDDVELYCVHYLDNKLPNYFEAVNEKSRDIIFIYDNGIIQTNYDEEDL